MSLQARISSLAGSIGGDIKGILADISSINTTLANGTEWLPSLVFAKQNPQVPAWVKSGGGLVTSQAINATVGMVSVAHPAGVVIALPTLIAGADYAIYATQAGALVASTNWTAPTGETTSTTRKLGGFHVSLSGTIFEYSLWDLNYRPSCPNPRGMQCVGGNFWIDIYYLGVDHITNGTSKSGVTIADGGNPPKVPVIFGGDGTLAYQNCNWHTAKEVLQSHGKFMPTWDEFSMAAFGVSEGTAVGSDPITTKADLPRRSKWGVEQITGNLYQWGAEVQGSSGGGYESTSSGNVYHPKCSTVLFGGNWEYQNSAGSKSALWNVSLDNSLPSIGVRGRSDHVCLQADR